MFLYLRYSRILFVFQSKILEKKSLPKSTKKRKVIRVDQEFEDWAPKLETDVQNPNHVLPTYWLILARENGNLYVYGIPEMHLVYMVKKFNLLPNVLQDDLASAFEDVSNEPLVSIAPSASSLYEGQQIMMDSVIVKPEEVGFLRSAIFLKNLSFLGHVHSLPME